MSGQSGGRNGRSREPGARGKIAALLFVVVLAGVLFWAMQAFVRHNALQNCIDSGRRDCAERTQTP